MVPYGPDGATLARAHGGARAATDTGMVMVGLNDENYRILRTDRFGSLANATNALQFSESFEGTTISLSRLSTAVTTYAFAQNATGLNFNSAASAAANANAVMNTLRQFPKYQRAPLHMRIRARVAQVANAVQEFGFGSASGATAIAIGAYWQVTSGGVVQPVLTFNGTDVPGTAVTMPSGWQSSYYTWDVLLDDDEAYFAVQDTSTGLIIAERRIQLAVTQQKLWNATHLPVFARVYSTGSAPATAPNLIVAAIDVVLLDIAQNKPWGHQQAVNGSGSNFNPTAFTQSAQWSNSAAPSNATLSNTAAGYTTLGGLFSFVAVAGAATDYALFGYTVPSPYTFVCTGADINTWNTGAAVATTPTLLVWGLGIDQSAISLAGTITRVPIGAQAFVVGAAVGANAERVSADFSQAPLVTNAGRIMTVILRMPVATNTASQVIQGLVTLKGYFE